MELLTHDLLVVVFSIMRLVSRNIQFEARKQICYAICWHSYRQKMWPPPVATSAPRTITIILQWFSNQTMSF